MKFNEESESGEPIVDGMEGVGGIESNKVDCGRGKV
jgi:hypothetical protein